MSAFIQHIKNRWTRCFTPARTRDEYDFLPAYLEIVERPISPSYSVVTHTDIIAGIDMGDYWKT